MDSKGFTLIELIVSLFIITLLIGIGGGSLMRYGERNREKERLTHEQTVNDALVQCYALEGRFPEYKNPPGTGPEVWKQHLHDEYFVLFIDSQYDYIADAISTNPPNRVERIRVANK